MVQLGHFGAVASFLICLSVFALVATSRKLEEHLNRVSVAAGGLESCGFLSVRTLLVSIEGFGGGAFSRHVRKGKNGLQPLKPRVCVPMFGTHSPVFELRQRGSDPSLS